jgi:uncharacterized membrane protein
LATPNVNEDDVDGGVDKIFIYVLPLHFFYVLPLHFFFWKKKTAKKIFV